MREDIAVDENGDLDISSGDLNFVPSDNYHIQDIIYSYAGFWRNAPQIGVGIYDYIESQNKDQQLTQNITLQLKSDGYASAPEIVRKGETFIVNANASI